jgi:hypothetical protein
MVSIKCPVVKGIDKIDNIQLIPVKIVIESCQLGALRFLRDIVSQQSQFRQGIVGVAMPQFPFGAL